MRIRRAVIPLLLVATSSLAACGGDGGDGGDGDDKAADDTTTQASQDADESTDTSACDLLTTDEVAVAVGSPVKEGIATSGPAVTGGSFDTCVWQSADPDNPADTATVSIYPNAAAADSARSDDSQDLDGIGDKAFTVAFAGIWVYAGEQSLLAQWYAFGGTDEDNLPKSEALAKAVVDAL